MTMRLHTYHRLMEQIGIVNAVAFGLVVLFVVCVIARRVLDRELIITLFYVALYMIASPTAILVNKLLMKDHGFGYPVLVSALGQTATAACAALAVQLGYVSTENGQRVERSTLVLLGGASALSLVLGQYPYLYLTVAFIQMLKAFSPAYMVVFLYCLGVEQPSRKVIACVLGLSVFTAIASAGEVNFSLIGVAFMAGATSTDALRLVLAQKLLKNQKMMPMETLYYISPICLLWMLPAALLTELPAVSAHRSFAIVASVPWLFLASALAGCFVNFTSFLVVRRTSSMTLKTLTMARNGGLVIVSALVMGEEISSLEAFGYTGLLICFAMYTVVKANESAAKPTCPTDRAMQVQPSTPSRSASSTNFCVCKETDAKHIVRA